MKLALAAAMNRRIHALALMTALAGGLASAGSSHALDYVWRGGPGVWNSLNWNGGPSFPLGDTDRAFVDGGAVAISMVDVVGLSFAGVLGISVGDLVRVVNGGSLPMGGDVTNNGRLELGSTGATTSSPSPPRPCSVAAGARCSAMAPATRSAAR